MPRVNIVIPAFNAQDFIAETVRSALAQTMGDLQVTVINDGSSDATAERAACHDPRLKVISSA